MTEYQQTKYYFLRPGGSPSERIFPELSPVVKVVVITERAIGVRRCIPTVSAGSYLSPGATHVFDGGCGVGAKVLNVEFFWISFTKLAQIENDIFYTNSIAPFKFSDSVTIWHCVWDTSNPIEKRPIPGCKSGCGVVFHMRVLDIE